MYVDVCFHTYNVNPAVGNNNENKQAPWLFSVIEMCYFFLIVYLNFIGRFSQKYVSMIKTR